MKTIEQIIESHKTNALDGRDTYRLVPYLTDEQVLKLGLTFTDDYAPNSRTIREFTRDNILEDLKSDVAFGFEKALNKRGLSSGAMFSVVMMWNRILEEGLENFDESNYAQYGLPLFKATALKYGWDNPIGNDSGSEFKYSADAD